MIGGIFAIMSMNIVDTFYVAQLGTNELAAMSFTFPVISVLLSLAFGIGVGTSSLVSRAIGAGDKQAAQIYCTNALLVATLVALLFAWFGYHNIDRIFELLAAPPHLMPLIHQFMDIWFLGSFIVIVPMVGNSAIRAAGNTKLPSLVMIAVALVNMCLDPILIFGLLGAPKLGVAGAALSTISAYLIALVLGLYYLTRKFDFINIRACRHHVGRSWVELLWLAIPAIGSNLIAPMSIAIMTRLVANVSPQAVAGFGIATRIESLILVIIMGLSSVIGPFVGQNWGALRYDRVREGVIKSFTFCFLWGAFAALTLAIGAPLLIKLFTTDVLVFESAKLYLYVVPISYGFLGVVMVSSSAANGMGRAIPALVMSSLRLIIIYLPLSIVLGHLFGLIGYYAASAVSSIIVGLGAIVWFNKTHKRCLT